MAICFWKYDQENGGYETDCGNHFIVADGNPEQNGMHYCCYCGKRLAHSKSMLRRLEDSDLPTFRDLIGLYEDSPIKPRQALNRGR